jgi:hypothetical protein
VSSRIFSSSARETSRPPREEIQLAARVIMVATQNTLRLRYTPKSFASAAMSSTIAATSASAPR